MTALMCTLEIDGEAFETELRHDAAQLFREILGRLGPGGCGGRFQRGEGLSW